jgi:hypothetical protein
MAIQERKFGKTHLENVRITVQLFVLLRTRMVPEVVTNPCRSYQVLGDDNTTAQRNYECSGMKH